MMQLIITGVGGQGTVSLGHLLGNIAKESKLNVIAAETHGMSQRGGSVIFHLKIGEFGINGMRSPLVSKGTADIIISGEPMEALRVIEFLKPNGVVITNTHGVASPVATQLGLKYPELNKLLEEIESWPAHLNHVNTAKLAKDNDIKGENLLLLGMFISLNLIDLKLEDVEKIIIARWPKFAESNLKALRLGFKQIVSV